MRRGIFLRFFGCLICMVLIGIVFGCASQYQQPVAKNTGQDVLVSEQASAVPPDNLAKDRVNCPTKIFWDITKAAYVTGFSCNVKPYKGKEMLQYTISFKNVASEPYRFRVLIIDPAGKSVGGLIPRKGKPPVLKPGKEAKFTYPVPAHTTVPEQIEVIVKEIKM